MDGSCERVRVVAINVCAPDGAARADLLALLFGEVEAWDADGQGAVLLALVAWYRERCGCVGQLGGEGGRRSGGLEDGRV